MTSMTCPFDQAGTGWLPELLSGARRESKTLRWWHWLLVSLGYSAGCSSVPDAPNFVSRPLQATGQLLAQASDQIGDALEPIARPGAPCPVAKSDSQAITAHGQSPLASHASAVAASGARHGNVGHLAATAPAPQGVVEDIPPPPLTATTSETFTPNFVPPIPAPPPPPAVFPAQSPAQDVFRSPTAPAPIAPPEPLPAQTVSASRPVTVTPTPTVTPTSAAKESDNVQWCRVRVRHVGSKPATQIAVSVSSPAGAQLLWNDAHSGPTTVGGRLDYPAIAQLAPQAEQALVVGIRATDESQRRLRVQVRDAQGGSHQDVQSRWQVQIEPLDKP